SRSQPEACVLGLAGRTPEAGSPTEILDFVVVGSPLLAAEGDWRLWPELRGACDRKRLQVRPCRPGCHRGRNIRARSGLGPVEIMRIRAVLGACLQDLCSDGFTELDPLRLRVAVRDRGEVA